MKKILITLMLLVGAFSGFSQTFDFGCGPDREGTGWELYIEDRLVIDNVVWPWEPSAGYYEAPESEYNTDAIDGLGIGRAGTTDGDSWSINSNGIDGTTWTGTPPDRGPLQGIITWVRDIPYVTPMTGNFVSADGNASYTLLSHVLDIDGVEFNVGDLNYIRFDAPRNWASTSVEVRFRDGTWQIITDTTEMHSTFNDFVVALRLLKTVVLPILTHSDGYSYNPNTLVLTANGRNYTSQGTDQVQRYHLNDDWPENLSVEHYQNQENDSWGILQNGVRATYHATFNAMVDVLIPRLIVRQPILGTGGNTWNPNNGTLTINGNTVQRSGFESGSPFYNLPHNYSNARGFIRILRRTNGDWDLNNLSDFAVLGSYETFDEMIVGLLRASGRRFEHMNAWYNSTVEINPDDPNERGTFRVGDVYFLRSRSGGDQNIFTAPAGWAATDMVVRFIVRDDGRFNTSWTRADGVDGGTSNSNDYNAIIEALLPRKIAITEGIDSYDAATNTFTYDGVVWTRRGNTFESPSSQFSTRVIVEPLADGRWKRITQNQIGFFDTFAILVVDLDFRRTN